MCLRPLIVHVERRCVKSAGLRCSSCEVCVAMLLCFEELKRVGCGAEYWIGCDNPMRLDGPEYGSEKNLVKQ